MSRLNFISMPVADLAASRAFYEALGFGNNPQFSDDSTACMTWSESFFVMIMTKEKWQTFTDRPIPNRGSSAMMLGLACDSREEVDERAVRAGGAGGVLDAQPITDHGFMYSRTITDPDDQIWEVMWMDPATAHGQITADAES